MRFQFDQKELHLLCMQLISGCVMVASMVAVVVTIVTRMQITGIMRKKKKSNRRRKKRYP